MRMHNGVGHHPEVPVRDAPYQPLDIAVAREPKPDRSARRGAGSDRGQGAPGRNCDALLPGTR